MGELDFSKGYLTEDVLIIHHDEQPEIKEQYHYETIKEYLNGGKDVEKIIDVEGVEYKEAYDEYLDIYVFKLFTKEELKINELNNLINNKQADIDSLKLCLLNTDYKVLKYIDGLYTDEEYAPIKAQRQIYRNEINNIENKINELQKELDTLKGE